MPASRVKGLDVARYSPRIVVRGLNGRAAEKFSWVLAWSRLQPAAKRGAKQVFLDRQGQGGVDPQPAADLVEGSLVSRFVKHQDAGRAHALRRGKQRLEVGQAVAEIGLVVEIGHDDGGRRFPNEADRLALRPFGDHGVAEFLIELLVAGRTDEGVDHEQAGSHAHAAVFLLAGVLAAGCLVVAFLVVAFLVVGFLVVGFFAAGFFAPPASAFFSAAGFAAAFLVGFLAGPLATRAAIRPSASSSVISSGEMSFGSVALVVPCLT